MSELPCNPCDTKVGHPYDGFVWLKAGALGTRGWRNPTPVGIDEASQCWSMNTCQLVLGVFANPQHGFAKPKKNGALSQKLGQTPDVPPTFLLILSRECDME